MRLDGNEFYWLAAIRAGVIHTNVKGHDGFPLETLSASRQRPVGRIKLICNRGWRASAQKSPA